MMTRDRPDRQPRTNKRKGKSDISLVLIKRVNLALWLGQEAGWPRLPTAGGRAGLLPRVIQCPRTGRQAGLELQEGQGAHTLPCHPSHLPLCLPLPGQLGLQDLSQLPRTPLRVVDGQHGCEKVTRTAQHCSLEPHPQLGELPLPKQALSFPLP